MKAERVFALAKESCARTAFRGRHRVLIHVWLRAAAGGTGASPFQPLSLRLIAWPRNRLPIALFCSHSQNSRPELAGGLRKKGSILRGGSSVAMMASERVRADHLIGDARDPLIVSSLYRPGRPRRFESSLHS